MPGYTPEEIGLISQIQGAVVNPDKNPGGGFSVPLMLAIFARVVSLRDSAAAQITTNLQLMARITDLENQVAVLSGIEVDDIGEIYMNLTPGSESEDSLV